MEKSLIDEIAEDMKEDYKKKYPEKALQFDFFSSQPICVDKIDVEELEKEFPAAIGSIHKELSSICKYFNKKPFKEATKKYSIKCIKKNILLRNINVSVEKKEEKEKPVEFKSIEDSKLILQETYTKLMSLFDYYMDMPYEDKVLDSIYCITTHFYKEFETFPILFINATKSSGKTRLMKIFEKICWNGKMMASLKEAVLFRSAGKHTIIIDEFENIGQKGNENVRELLNTCYKKGMKVSRMKKVRTFEGEEQVMEDFETFTPVVIANIWGVEEILGDRGITQILEKSEKREIIDKIENFDTDLLIQQVYANFSLNLVQLCSYFGQKHIYTKWNEYICMKSNTLTTHTTYTTDTTLTTQEIDFFNKIYDTGVKGRNLEIFFPLIITSKILGDSIFEDFLKVVQKYIESKKSEEITESKDVLLYSFVASKCDTEPIKVKQLTNEFRNFIGEDEGEEMWINSRWMGRAIKRLNLVVQKWRIGEGVQVILDIKKAQEKIKMFR